MSVHPIDVAEYERLRGEIDNRTQIANALVAVDLTALGVGLASLPALPEIVIGIAAASIFLWMLWTDQGVQVWKIAAYMEIELAPRLRESSPDVLGWEPFLRRLDKGGPSALAALGLDDSTHRLHTLKTANVGLYISALFGGAPLVLLAVGAGAMFEDLSGAGRLALGLALVASLVGWTVAFLVYRRFRAFRSIIDEAIEQHASRGAGPAR